MRRLDHFTRMAWNSRSFDNNLITNYAKITNFHHDIGAVSITWLGCETNDLSSSSRKSLGVFGNLGGEGSNAPRSE